MTLANVAPGRDLYGTGAGLLVDEFYAPADVTITGGTIAGNDATNYFGGGLAVVRDSGVAGRALVVRLDGTTVAGNTNELPAGGLLAAGGGIFLREGTLTLTNATIAGNTAPHGGGIYNQGGSLTIVGGTIRDNTATGAGGGLSIHGTATLTDVTIRDNTALGAGGGGLWSTYVNVTLRGVTLSGNTASNGAGGAISHVGGTTSLADSTVSGNAARSGGGIAVGIYGTVAASFATIVGNRATASGGGIYAAGEDTKRAAALLDRSVVAGNLVGAAAQDCAVNAYGGVASGGYNLVGGAGGCPANGAGDVSLITPLAGALAPALADNGGPTRTHNVVPGGPAHNRIPASTCPLSGDQRGVVRP